MKFLLASLKTLIDQFFPVYMQSRLSEQFSGSQAGIGTTFRDTGGYQKAGTSSLKRVTGMNFTITVVSYVEASRNFNLDFHHKKKFLNCENHKLTFKKVLLRFLRP
jgi:hypothetical protein